MLLRKSLKQPEGVFFNVFTADLKSEAVGLAGGTLREQVKFIKSCIDTILELYDLTDNSPRSVVLVGHSVGGIVARGVVMLDGFDLSSISAILTYATPNQAPVLSADHEIAGFYSEVNLYWKTNAKRLQEITVLSIGAGDNDFQVRHSLTKLPTNDRNTLCTSTVVIPSVQLTTDHQAVVWCKQLVLVTSRFLFSLIDANTRQITDSSTKRNDIMRSYFSEPFYSVEITLRLSSKVKLFTTYEKSTITEQYWSMQSAKEKNGAYYVFPLKHYLNDNSSLFVARIIASLKKWILVCTAAKTDDCTHAIDLSSHAISMAAFKVIHLSLEELYSNGFTHLIIRIPPNINANTEVNVVRPTYINITVPSIFSNLWTLNKGFSYPSISKTNEKQFYHVFNLGGLTSVFQTFFISVRDSSAVLRLDTSWDQSQTVIGINNLSVKLRNTPLVGDNVVLHVYSSSNNVSITMQAQFIKAVEQILLHHYASIPVFIVANLLLAYAYQIKELAFDRMCPTVDVAHSINAKPYKIQPFVSIVHAFYRYQWFADAWNVAGLPEPDSVTLEQEYRDWFNFCPLIMFLFAYEIFSLQIVIQRIMNFVLIAVIKVKPIRYLSFLIASESKYIRISVHSILISILLLLNSSFAFLYMYVVTVVSCCWEAVIFESQSQSDEKTSSEASGNAATPTKQIRNDLYHLHFTLSLLWAWLFLFSLPTLLFNVMQLQ